MSIIKNCLIMVYKSNRNTINHQKIYPIIHPSIEIRISKEIKSICTVFVSYLINHDHQSILIKIPPFQKRNSPAQCFYYRNHFSIYFGFLRKNSELRRNSQVCKEGPQVVSRFGICLTRLLVRSARTSCRTFDFPTRPVPSATIFPEFIYTGIHAL